MGVIGISIYKRFCEERKKRFRETGNTERRRKLEECQ